MYDRRRAQLRQTRFKWPGFERGPQISRHIACRQLVDMLETLHTYTHNICNISRLHCLLTEHYSSTLAKSCEGGLGTHHRVKGKVPVFLWSSRGRWPPLVGEMSLAFTVSVWRFTTLHFPPHHSLTQQTKKYVRQKAFENIFKRFSLPVSFSPSWMPPSRWL